MSGNISNKESEIRPGKILITGAAGFIGFHLANRLIGEGYEVVGLDNINDYYDPALKYDRLAEAGINKEEVSWNELVQSNKYQGYRFIRMDLGDAKAISDLFKEEAFDYVVNLAAQAGVRYSLENPHAYIDSNITGFLNILEGCRHHSVKHLVYASSSSVYGLNEKMPLSENDNVDHPVSLYAATKKSNELMAHTYSHLYGLPTTGLRFFTVYGPWGRPDMALFIFTKAALEGRKINVFNHGEMIRDFTYVEEIVQAVHKVLFDPPVGDKTWSGENPRPASSKARFRLYNIGNSNPVKLMDFIEEIEVQLGKKIEMNMLPIQPGDVRMTFADTELLQARHNYKPSTSIRDGVKSFLEWYYQYYDVRL